MKSIFLCDDPCTHKRVFSERIVSPLRNQCELEENVYTKDDVLSSACNFSDTEYIFSTWGMPEFDEEEIKRFFPKLKCIFYGAGTVQDFAKPFLNCGVRVFSAWGANAVPVAEYTVAQIILANKGFFSLAKDYKIQKRAFNRERISGFIGNYDANIGIIGAGMIGSLVIDMLKNYKLNIFVFDPFLSEDKAKAMNVEKVSLEELFKRCNVVSNHLANNEQTKDMLCYKHFSTMKENAVFINTGRGAQVVEEDLIKVLKEREDITAILDVTMPEPPEDDSMFGVLDNCILTPHIAGSLGLEVQRMAEFMLDEFMRYKNGTDCKYEVTLKMLETMA